MRTMGTTKQKRAAVFIDGSNFYFKLKSLISNKTDFIHYHYRELLKDLLNPDERLAYVGYYVGVVRDGKQISDREKAAVLVQNQQRLFEQLRHQNIALVKGYLLERGGTFFEKGVDVRLALDIVTMAQERQYDVAYVVSSDTDLIPAMVKAMKLKKEVVHVGFEHQPSVALIRQSSRHRVITRKEAEKYASKPITINRYDEEE